MGAQKISFKNQSILKRKDTGLAYAESNRQGEAARQCTARGQRNTILIIHE